MRVLTYSAAGPMDVLTALPLSIAIREMARGNMDKTGVLAPEAPGALNPPHLFHRIERKGSANSEGPLKLRKLRSSFGKYFIR